MFVCIKLRLATANMVQYFNVVLVQYIYWEYDNYYLFIY